MLRNQSAWLRIRTGVNTRNIKFQKLRTKWGPHNGALQNTNNIKYGSKQSQDQLKNEVNITQFETWLNLKLNVSFMQLIFGPTKHRKELQWNKQRRNDKELTS